MDPNGGKPLSPWKVPSRISLKRIRHKINSDLSLQTLTSTATTEKTCQKRNRLIINKFALARSISTPTSDENVTPTLSQTNDDQHLLARLHQIMPPPPASNVSNDQHFNSTMKSFSFDETSNNSESSQLTNFDFK
jgi:hypothetical protein